MSLCYLLSSFLAIGLCVTLSECTYYQPRITITAGTYTVNRVGEYASYTESAPLDIEAATLILVEDGNFGCRRRNISNVTLPPLVDMINVVIVAPLKGGCSAYSRATWAYTHGVPAIVFYYFPSKQKSRDPGSSTLPITVVNVKLEESELNHIKSSTTADYGRISIEGEYSGLFQRSHTFYFVVFAFCILMILSCMWFAMSYVKRFRYSIRARRRRAETQNEIRRVMNSLPVRTHKVSKGNDEYTCAVCLELFRNKDLIRTLPCDHEFHKKCIDPWIKIKRTCPMCKQNISENIPRGNTKRKTNRSSRSVGQSRVVSRDERNQRQASLLDNQSIESNDSDVQTEAANREGTVAANVHVITIQPSLEAVRIHTIDETSPVEGGAPPVAHVAVLLEDDDTNTHTLD